VQQLHRTFVAVRTGTVCTVHDDVFVRRPQFGGDMCRLAREHRVVRTFQEQDRCLDMVDVVVGQGVRSGPADVLGEVGDLVDPDTVLQTQRALVSYLMSVLSIGIASASRCSSIRLSTSAGIGG